MCGTFHSNPMQIENEKRTANAHFEYSHWFSFVLQHFWWQFHYQRFYLFGFRIGPTRNLCLHSTRVVALMNAFGYFHSVLGVPYTICTAITHPYSTVNYTQPAFHALKVTLHHTNSLPFVYSLSFAGSLLLYPSLPIRVPVSLRAAHTDFALTARVSLKHWTQNMCSRRTYNQWIK